MWWPFQWLVIYVLGGLTFVPLLIVTVIWYVLTYGSVPVGDDDPAKRVKAQLQAENEREELVEKEKNKAATSTGPVKPLSGWLTVRRQFAPAANTSSIFLPTTTTTSTPNTNIANSKVDIGSLDVPTDGEDSSVDKDDLSLKSGTSTPNPIGTPSSSVTAASIVAPTTYSARIAQTYRQVMESRQKKETAPKEYLFGVLKGSVLFLYEDEAQSECVAAIGLERYIVGVEGKEGGRFEGKDAEMFAKRNAVVLRVWEGGKDGKNGLPVLTKGMGTGVGGDAGQKEDAKEAESAPWFLFSKSNTKLEDWYLALTQVSALKPSTQGVFSENDMQALVDTIDTEPDPIPMRWLNAMLGRVFFGLYRTEALEQFIINKIMKKLSKVPRPNFLGPIVIREVNVGTFPPIFSKPMLKDLTAEGTAAFEVHLNYRSRVNQPNSEVRITIATTATIPTGFKPYVVDLVLAVVLKSFEGNMVMQIKKPPSNRVWYGFTQMPKMEVEIQPVVSERKIQIGMVLKAIEKQLRDVIAESVVLPNMDDFAFFDTSELDIRGGIFSVAGKKVDGSVVDIPAGGTEPPTQPGVEIPTSAEDPASATAETPALRKRRPTKSQTMGPPGLEQEKEPEGIPRIDTAPAGFLFNQNNTSSSTIQATKKWLGNAARPSSISSLAGMGVSNASKESFDSYRSKSVERNPAHVAGPSAEGPSKPLLASTGAEGKNREVGLGISTDTLIAKPSQTSPQGPARTSFDSSSTATSSTNRGLPDSPTSSTNTSSLITSLRARDKKAIQSQVTTARDAMKKWGVNWAAKKRTQFGGTLDEEPSDRPAAVYRPPDEDELHKGGDAGLSKSAEAPKSLQDRLNAAAAAAAANRPKSGSVSSTSPSQSTAGTVPRPTLQPSPSKSSVSSFGSSPPQWTLSGAAPTTEIAKADVAAKSGGIGTSAQSHLGQVNDQAQSKMREKTERSGSTSNPVLTQPIAGKTMMVPRVPRRPGEVVAIGSSPSGITRRISGSEQDAEKPKLDGPPPLPVRKSQEMDRPEQLESTVLPPKLSSRKVSPEPTALHKNSTEASILATSTDNETSSSRSPPDLVEMSRSDSAPASTAVPPLPPRSSEAQKGDVSSITGTDSNAEKEGTSSLTEPHAMSEGASDEVSESEDALVHGDNGDIIAVGDVLAKAEGDQLDREESKEVTS